MFLEIVVYVSSKAQNYINVLKKYIQGLFGMFLFLFVEVTLSLFLETNMYFCYSCLMLGQGMEF